MTSTPYHDLTFCRPVLSSCERPHDVMRAARNARPPLLARRQASDPCERCAHRAPSLQGRAYTGSQKDAGKGSVATAPAGSWPEVRVPIANSL